ncbi:unnamed protein product [Toxocara canis]|uniref:Peptidase A1 domain-containing protein n=1 Tax=Toxocara canis TaxID=6265 RepID=A0A183UJM6_TOXCA|nr:unnamed protein product [Toxocara canis]
MKIKIPMMYHQNGTATRKAATGRICCFCAARSLSSAGRWRQLKDGSLDIPKVNGFELGTPDLKTGVLGIPAYFKTENAIDLIGAPFRFLMDPVDATPLIVLGRAPTPSHIQFIFWH